MKIYSVKQIAINEGNVCGTEVGATYYKDIEDAMKDYCERHKEVKHSKTVEIIKEDKSFETNTLGCFIYCNPEKPEAKMKITLNRHELK